MTIDDLIKFAVDNNASDLHISGNEPPIIRIAGKLRKLDLPELTEEDVKTMIRCTLSDKQKKQYEETWDLDYSYNLPGIARCRANAFVGTRGECASFRLVHAEVIPWDSLGLPENIKALAHKEKGLVLVTGPAGCGKSTTMSSFIDVINKERAAHILTVEDPIEFLHEPKKSLITHRQVGRDTNTFSSALKGALREDPDVILVGEMRDRETIQLALTAAETGHLVVSTLHTNSAPKTISRIINAFPASDQGQIRTMLAEGLLAVVSQVLVPKKDGNSVMPAFEVLIATSTVRSMIRADKLHEIPSAIETGMKHNMRSLQKSLGDLITGGLCSRADCEKFVENPYALPEEPNFAVTDYNYMAEIPSLEPNAQPAPTPVVDQATQIPQTPASVQTAVSEQHLTHSHQEISNEVESADELLTEQLPVLQSEEEIAAQAANVQATPNTQ
jgi:twitching motility protein PilT